jgi:hypothetical protein
MDEWSKFDGGQLTNQEKELRDFTNDFLILQSIVQH